MSLTDKGECQSTQQIAFKGERQICVRTKGHESVCNVLWNFLIARGVTRNENFHQHQHDMQLTFRK